MSSLNILTGWIGESRDFSLLECNLRSQTRNVDDTYVQRKKNDVDKLFEELNSYNEIMKLTLDINPKKLLDTELVWENGEITTQVFSKSTELPVNWKSRIHVRYKRNVVTGELHQAK